MRFRDYRSASESPESANRAPFHENRPTPSMLVAKSSVAFVYLRECVFVPNRFDFFLWKAVEQYNWERSKPWRRRQVAELGAMTCELH